MASERLPEGKSTETLAQCESFITLLALGVFCLRIGYQSGLQEGREEKAEKRK